MEMGSEGLQPGSASPLSASRVRVKAWSACFCSSLLPIRAFPPPHHPHALPTAMDFPSELRSQKKPFPFLRCLCWSILSQQPKGN